MKQIRITHYNEPKPDSVFTKDKYYSIVLGNGATISFKDKKKIVYFLTSVNKQLTEALQELVLLYADLFKEYWNIWFYLDQHVDTIETRERNKKIESHCISEFNYIPTLLNIAVDRSHFQNGNHFAFNHLYNVIKALQSINKMLIRLRQEKLHTAEVNRLELFDKALLRIKKEMDKIGY